MFFIGHPEERKNASNKYSTNGSILSRGTQPSSTSECPHSLSRSYSLNHRHHNWSHSPYTSMTTPLGTCQNYYNATATNGIGHQNTTTGNYQNSFGRLQKSHSFAFQTPQMMNSELAYHQQQQQPYHGTSISACNSIDRRYSRYV